jgi:multicopper oxidase
MIDSVGALGDQGRLTSASWLLVAFGVGLLLVWGLRWLGRSSGSRLGATASVTGGLVALALGFVGVWLADNAAGPLAGSTHPAAAQPASAPVSQADGQVRQFQLTVGRTQWELAPGKVVDAYSYNGQVPGPELRVTEGDTVRVTVTNELDEPTTVHWHGVDVPAAMDGVPDTSGPPIAPGGTFTYEFVATPAGTRWYHAHFDEMNQQAGGLTGALVIEPRDPPATRPDREYTLITGEWLTADGTQPLAVPTPSAGGGMAGMAGNGMGGGTLGNDSGMSTTRPPFDTFTVNGKAYPSAALLVVNQGERVRLRLINASATDTQVFALAGHRLTMTHSDGNPLASPVEVDAVPLGVGERADVEFVADNPGRWKLEALMPALSDRGQMVDLTDVVYAGHEGDVARDFPSDARIKIANYTDLTGPPHPAAPDRTYELTLSGGMMMMGMGSDAWTINGRSYPDTPPIDVKVGQRVRLRLFNMSMEDHPMHLHGHTFQLVAVNGRSVDGPLKDTITLRHMEQYDIEFVANNPGTPGTWLFHCHNLVHMMGGLMTEVRYS